MWYDFAAWCRPIIILLGDDADMSPGPKPNSGQGFSICY